MSQSPPEFKIKKIFDSVGIDGKEGSILLQQEITADLFVIPHERLFWMIKNNGKKQKISFDDIMNLNLFQKCIKSPLNNKKFIQSQSRHKVFKMNHLFKANLLNFNQKKISQRQYMINFIQLMLIIQSKIITIEYNNNNQHETKYLMDHPKSLSSYIFNVFNSKPKNYQIMFETNKIYDLLWIIFSSLTARLFLNEDGVSRALGLYHLTNKKLLKYKYSPASNQMINSNIKHTTSVFNVLRKDPYQHVLSEISPKYIDKLLLIFKINQLQKKQCNNCKKSYLDHVYNESSITLTLQLLPKFDFINHQYHIFNGKLLFYINKIEKEWKKRERIEDTHFYQCKQCMIEKYCSKKCQKIDWPKHKTYCKYIKIKSNILINK